MEDSYNPVPASDPFYKFDSPPHEPWAPVEISTGTTTAEPFHNPSLGRSSYGDGIEIIWADDSRSFIPADNMLSDYDPEEHSNWSMVIPITTSAPYVFDEANITYDSTDTIYESDENGNQTKYRFNIIISYTVGGETYSTTPNLSGQFREVTTAKDGRSFQRLARVT